MTVGLHLLHEGVGAAIGAGRRAEGVLELGRLGEHVQGRRTEGDLQDLGFLGQRESRRLREIRERADDDIDFLVDEFLDGRRGGIHLGLVVHVDQVHFAAVDATVRVDVSGFGIEAFFDLRARRGAVAGERDRDTDVDRRRVGGRRLSRRGRSGFR